MIVYHGSDHIIEVPIYNGSKKTNDYGYGFYTTENPELAKEWAVNEEHNGYVRAYNKPEGGACFEVVIPTVKPRDQLSKINNDSMN